MVDKHVQEIIDWRESMTLFPEESFFELVRTYLGAIQTPYNKQKIVEELGAFLKNASNREKMLLLLDDTDRTILTAVDLIADCTSEKLTEFFNGVFSSFSLFEHLVSLEERLFIYSHTDSRTEKKIISIVPYMKDIVASFSSLSRLIPLSKVSASEKKSDVFLTQSLLSAIFSYIFENSDICKADFSLKKKTSQAFSEIFPMYSEKDGEVGGFFSVLIHSLFLLGVLKPNPASKRNDGNFIIDAEKAKAFSSLDADYQYAFLCSVNAGTSRSDIQEYAQILIDSFSLLEKDKDTGFTKNALLKAIYIINEKNHEREIFRRENSRFSRLIAESRMTAERAEDSFSRRAERVVDAAISLSLLQKIGENENGEAVFRKASVSENSSGGNEKVLSADAAFSVTMFPGLSLEESLSLMRVLNLRRFDTACVFELSKESAMRGFSSGLTGETLLSLLEKYSMYPLPQNVKATVEEWYLSYNSATLFKGYVLQVSSEKEFLVEGNPKISKHILKKIAPGVFFMDFNTDIDADVALIRSRLDFIARVDAQKKGESLLSFPLLRKGALQFSLDSAVESESEEESKKREEYLASLEQSVKEMQLDSDKKNELYSRIRRRMILNTSQLSGDSVRIEKLEAGAMDYIGKVHVIEHTIATKMMLEIEVDGEIFAGKPLSLEKRSSDALLSLIAEGERESRSFSVSSLLHVKRIRSALFSFDGE